MKKQYSHGEVSVFEIEKLPKGAKKLSPVNGMYIIANSETTGNHHCIEEKEGVDIYEKDGVLYMKNEVDANMVCVIKERHDLETLQPNIWEFDSAKEYDHLSQEQRNVAD